MQSYTLMEAHSCSYELSIYQVSVTMDIQGFQTRRYVSSTVCYGLICETAVHINSSQSGPVTLFVMKKKSFTYSHSQVYVYKGISMVGWMGLCKYFDVSLC